MVNRITPDQIRKTNRNIIYEYIYNNKDKNLSQLDITNALNLSRPTVASNLLQLEHEGLVFRSSIIDDDGEKPGRKPATWSVSKNYRIAIGVEIMKSVVKIIAVNLYGESLKCMILFTEYTNNEEYYKHISTEIKKFIQSLKLKGIHRKILGIGFAIQGLVSEDGTTVIYGEILKCTGLQIDVFRKFLGYPCSFIHEPDGAALAELWASPELINAIYLSISAHLGGAVIHNRKILCGLHRHSATFEHIQAIDENGELCYCGKYGCFETICSAEALLKDERPDEFFDHVRNNEPDASKRWRVFLEYLARMITHLHLVNDTKYILGGHLAPFFIDDDISFLYEKVREHTPFDEPDDYILVSKMPSHNITIGAALPYVINFLENIAS